MKEYALKIKPGRCRCGRTVHLVEMMGMVWTADTKPLDAQEAVSALLAGRELYRVAQVGENLLKLSYARAAILGGLNHPDPFCRPIVVASHPCPTGAVKEAGKTPSRPVAAPQTLPALDLVSRVLGGPARPGDASLPPF